MKLTAWSPSRLKTYEACPAQAKYKFIDKLPEPASPHLDRGTMLHKACEEYVNGVRTAIDPELSAIVLTLKNLRAKFKKGKAKVELSLAVNNKWEPVDWFHPKTYARFKIDVVELAPKKAMLITDWKTGQFRPSDEYKEQLELYNVAVLSHKMGTGAAARLVFVDTGRMWPDPKNRKGEPPIILSAAGLKQAQKKWDKRVEGYLNDEIFDPTPNFGCRWCPFSKAKGGPCRF
jgi:RecB family exonuclease